MSGEVTSIAVVNQWGKEVTPGTGVAATAVFDTFALIADPQADTRNYRPQGVKTDAIVQLTKEWSAADLTGWPSYVAEAYLWSCLMGIVTPTTVGTAGKQWLFTDDGVTPSNPQTFTMELGTAVRAAKWSYGCLHDYGFKWKRDGVTSDGKVIGQQYQDGITLSPSGGITRVAQAACAPGDFQMYIDTTSGGLGGTQYPDVYEVDFGVKGKFAPKWQAQRSNTSWATLVEVPAAWSAKIKVQANTAGMTPLTWIRAGQTVFVRMQFQGGLLPGEASTNYLYQIDLAASVSKPDKLEDEGGIYATSWTLTGVRDATWGKVAVVTLNNKLATL